MQSSRIIAVILATVPALAVALSVEGSEPLVESVRYLGIQFRGNDVDISGQDAATSILLPDGKETFWIFGDTIEGPFPESLHNFDLTDVLSNTASLIPVQDIREGIQQYTYLKDADGKRARQVIKHHADEDPGIHRLWGIHGTCVGDDLYLFYHKISMLPNTSVFDNFKLDGMGIARAKIGTFDFQRLKAPDGSREFWKGDQPGYGVFVEALEDGYLYLWGSYWTGMFLARTRPETIEDLDRYEYLVQAPTLAHPEGRAEVVDHVRPDGRAVRFSSQRDVGGLQPVSQTARRVPHLDAGESSGDANGTEDHRALERAAGRLQPCPDGSAVCVLCRQRASRIRAGGRPHSLRHVCRLQDVHAASVGGDVARCGIDGDRDDYRHASMPTNGMCTLESKRGRGT